MRRVRLVAAVLVPLLAMVGLGTVSAVRALASTTYYVSPSGSDSNTGASPGTPFQHIQACANVMTPGSTCSIGSGTYRETVVPKSSGTAAAPITYAADGPHVTVDGSDPVPGTAWSPVTALPSSVNGVPDPFLSSSPFATAVTSGHVFAAHVAIAQPLMGSDFGGMVRTTQDANPQVFYKGKMMMTAEFPASPATQDPMRPTIEVAASDGSSQMTIADPKLTQPAGYWVGATVYVMGSVYPQTVQVVASAPGSITICCIESEPSATFPPPQLWEKYTGPTPFSGGANLLCAAQFMTPTSVSTVRYFMYNKLESLGAAGDWFYDSNSQTLYFDSPTGSMPGDGDVGVKQRQTAFDLNQTANQWDASAPSNNISYTTISGVNVFASTITTGSNSWNDTLDGVDVNYPSYFLDLIADKNSATLGQNDCVDTGVTTSGVILRGHSNTIQNSTVQNSSGNGVVLWNTACPANSGQRSLGIPCYGPSTQPGNTATNNRIYNTDASGAVFAAGIVPIGDANTITHNTLSGCGRACINMTSDYAQAQHNMRIAYNDVSHYTMLGEDAGGIYSLGKIDFQGTRIDHNWAHDAEPLSGLDEPSAAGIYIDGGASNFQVDNNVGWNNVTGTITICCGSSGVKVYNNDGGGSLSEPNNACDANGNNCDEFVNNIGWMCSDCRGAPDARIVMSNNFPAPSGLPKTGVPTVNVDPKYADPRVADYRLQAASDAAVKDGGKVIPGVTDGNIDSCTDATGTHHCASMGAYQYGAPRWVPGAIAPDSGVMLHYAPNKVLSADQVLEAGILYSWQNPEHMTISMESAGEAARPATMTAMAGPMAANLKVGYVNPVANPADPMFANTSNLAIDSVHVEVYARTFDHLGSTVNLTLSAAGMGTIGDTGSVPFDSTGGPVVFDVTSRVGGNWNNLPAWVNLLGTMTAPAAGGPPGIVLGGYSAASWVHALEIKVNAHCIHRSAAPCSTVDNTPTPG